MKSLRPPGARAEQLHQVARAPRRAARPPARGRARARVIALEEADEDAGRACGRRVVDGQRERARAADGAAAHALRAPERLVVDREALDHRAHRHALRELVAVAGQRRVVRDPAGQRGRHRHDRALRAHLDAVGGHPHAVGRPFDAAHRRAQHHLVAEPFRDARWRACPRPRRSGPAARRPRCRAAGRACRQTRCRTACGGGTRPRASRPTPPSPRSPSSSRPVARRHVAAHPGPRRLAVPLLRLRRVPGRLERAPSTPSGRGAASPGRRRRPRAGAASGSCPCSGSAARRSSTTFSPGGPRRERRGAVAARQRIQPVLGGADPLAADVDPAAVADARRDSQAPARRRSRASSTTKERPARCSSSGRGQAGHARRPTIATSTSIEPCAPIARSLSPPSATARTAYRAGSAAACG